MNIEGNKPILKAIIENFYLVILGGVIALIMIEGFLRLYRPSPFVKTAVELSWIRDNPGYNIFTLDPDFGFRPILGNGLYNQFGTKVNDYTLEKRPGITRLLFIGDSATHRAKIVDALKEKYGEETFEYWNAGVESFNTVQEVNYYQTYNSAIRPDHVILTFHVNDFETTPIAFDHEGDGLIVYAPNKSLQALNPWLFKQSYFYRFIIEILGDATEDRETIVDETEDSLRGLRDILADDGISFTVLVLPVFLPQERWQPYEREARLTIIQILERLDISFFDLLETSDRAIENGVNVQEELGGHWHPSKEVSILFAEYLFDNGLLSK
ncbi:MAG: hypothetical protein OES12_09425 [Anaerolineae bacterium]|nr:hypothetical protein [Anaerolineae bacterium]